MPTNFVFNPTDGLVNASTYPTKPANESAARQQIQDPLNQLRDFINNTLITSLFIGAGLTGATQATRYAGATTSGAPTTGTFVAGDFVIDRTGAVWICTTDGSPGTWMKSSPKFQSRIPVFRGTFSTGSTANASIARNTSGFLSFQFKSNEWATNQFYAEVNVSVAAGATAYYGVYDITAGAVVAGSEISLTSSGNFGRTGVFTLTDAHEYGVYQRTSAGTSFIYGLDILKLF